MPSNIRFKNTLVISFGDAVLPIVVQEAAAKRGLVIGIADSNQTGVWSHVDYILPGNDDSIVVAYFFSLFLLNVFISVLSIEFKRRRRFKSKRRKLRIRRRYRRRK
jgi:ribosomal protein S2